MSEARELAVLEGGANAPVRSGQVDLLAVARQAEAAKELGKTLVASGFLPDAIKKPEQAVVVILKGQELSLPPLYALSQIAVVNGKPTLSAELMATLVRRAGHVLRIIESTNELCTVEGVRSDDRGHNQRLTFSIEDARQAGATSNPTWKKYPRSMLRSRAISELCRGMFSDALGGLGHTPEELGAEVDGEGHVISSPAPEVEIYREPAVEATVIEDQHARISTKKAGYLKGLMREAGVDRDKIEERYGPVEDLRPDQADKWIDELQRRIAGAKHADEPPPADEPPEDELGEPPAGRERGSGFAHDEQVEMLTELADTLGLGREGLEREIGHDLHAFTRDEAKAKIDELRERAR